MNKKLRLLSLLLCGVLLMGMMNGCGKDVSKTSTSTGTPTPEPTATLSPESTAAPTPEPVRETRWSEDYRYVVLDDQTAEITRYCGGDVELTIPSLLDNYSVTSIGYAAFDSCDSLNSVTIPDSVTRIGDRAFNGCYSLCSITIPDSVISIGINPFIACFELSSIAVSPDNPSLESIDGILYSKQERTLICDPRVFTAEEYSIPQGVQAVGSYAFGFCEKMSSVTIPDSVTRIGDGAFWGCKNLSNVTIPNSVTSIGDRAFLGCKNLSSVTIPDSVTSIGANPFQFCDALSHIAVSPDHPTLASIDGVLFSKPDKRLVCYPCAISAKEYSIPRGILTIGDGAFASCKSLTSVTIPDSVTFIGNGAFNSCENLTSVTIPESVTSIGGGAFGLCNLTSVSIPNSVTSIGTNPFYQCNELNSIDVSPDHPSLECIDGVLFSKPDKRLVCYPVAFTAEEYTIPQGVLVIGDYAFMSCYRLESVTIPESVNSIGNLAFYYSGLFSVTIPDGVSSIGDQAFNCNNLRSASIPNSVISIGLLAFYPLDATITVGRNSYAKQYCVDYGLDYIYSDQNDWLNN